MLKHARSTAHRLKASMSQQSRVKVKLLLANGSDAAQVYNDCSTSYNELCAKVQRKLGSTCQLGFVMSYDEGAATRQPLRNEEDFQALARLYQASSQGHLYGAATYRLKIYISLEPQGLSEACTPVHPRTQATTRHPDRVQVSCSQEKPVKRARRLGNENMAPSRSSPILGAEGGRRRAARAPTVPNKPHPHVPQPSMSPAAAAALSADWLHASSGRGGLDWDSALLSSIQRTVSRHHFGTQLSVRSSVRSEGVRPAMLPLSPA